MRAFKGKVVSQQRYLHVSAKALISAREQERVEVASKAIINENWNVIRLDLANRMTISLMEYESFSASAFPALLKSYKIDIDNLTCKIQRYSQKNPPILHRKELLINPSLDEYKIYSQLTKELENLGAFKEMYRFGTRERWNEHLNNLGIFLQGHQVTRSL